MAIVCPRCSAIVQSAGRCRRCNTTWFVRAHAVDPPKQGSGESPYLARTGRPRFERIIEHDRRDIPRSGEVRPVERIEGGRQRKPHAAGALGIGRRLFGGWLGAVTGVAVGGLIAILALQLAVAGTEEAPISLADRLGTGAGKH